MAHFAQLDDDNVVINVIAVANQELLSESGEELEAKGIIFCQTLFGNATKWKQTSYNGAFRKNYAGIGYVYDPSRDAFIDIKPYASWTLDENTCIWTAPSPCPPIDGKSYVWDEASLSWIGSDIEQNTVIERE